ncbi:MAG: HEAT repeat domain-containing protein [Methanomicrobiaceae archaeon]|nr:HEAT repeat domain-containing protein [Methanomicrobiaceae archaeon]
MQDSYYYLSREERDELIEEIERGIKQDLKNGASGAAERYGSYPDAYIRRMVSRILGWLYRDRPDLRSGIMDLLKMLLRHPDEKVRQTAVYTIAEIAIADTQDALRLLDLAVHDSHPAVQRGVGGVLKKMGKRDFPTVLQFALRYLHHSDPELRRIAIHGLELHGRTNPEDLLPLLRELQHDPSPRVRGMAVHVIGQISYREGCLEKVAGELKTWDNRELVELALNEILDVHERYESFSELSFEEALEYLKREFPA